MKTRRAMAFTLVELLVVIAIIAMLVTLLLPAVQAAREAARRTQCINHLRQLGLTLHSHHSARNEFPPGIVMTGPCCNTVTLTGWTIEVLPFMEDANLRALYNPQLSNGDVANQSVRETFIPIYHCPSDFQPQLLTPDSGPEGGWSTAKRKWMTGSYRGVAGRSNGPATWDLAEELNTVPRGWRGPLHATGREADGLPFDMHPERFAKILDGTSKTLMVGEQTNTFAPRRTFWAYTFGDYLLSQGVPQRRIFNGDYQKCTAINGPGGNRPCMRAWYSHHPGGMNFVRCDSSGAWISFEIDVEVFSALCSISGEEAAGINGVP